jgi:uncharacterized protein YuzE
MSRPYLEVTYRQGKALAAYLYLDRRTGDKVDRSERHGSWLLDLTSDGRPIGIEFTKLGDIDLAAVNRALSASQLPPIRDADLAPLKAA